MAIELFNKLQPKNADFVTEEEMKEHLDDVLKLYLKAKEDDKSGLCTPCIISAIFVFLYITSV